MEGPELHRRLDALIAALAPPALSAPAVRDDVADGSGADAQWIATSHIDELLRRVSALTAVLSAKGPPALDCAQARKGGHDEQDPPQGAHYEGDDVDQLAARLLMTDLATFASATRALNELSASRLASALAVLRAAGADIEHSLKEVSGS